MKECYIEYRKAGKPYADSVMEVAAVRADGKTLISYTYPTDPAIFDEKHITFAYDSVYEWTRQHGYTINMTLAPESNA